MNAIDRLRDMLATETDPTQVKVIEQRLRQYGQIYAGRAERPEIKLAKKCRSLAGELNLYAASLEQEKAPCRKNSA